MRKFIITGSIVIIATGTVTLLMVANSPYRVARIADWLQRPENIDCRDWDGGAAALPGAPYVRSSSDLCLVKNSMRREFADMARDFRRAVQEQDDAAVEQTVAPLDQAPANPP